jgi:nucleoside-diphosphate-sugar epimerase
MGMTQHKTVLLAGANGVLGGHLARALTGAGHTGDRPEQK